MFLSIYSGEGRGRLRASCCWTGRALLRRRGGGHGLPVISLWSEFMSER